MRKDNTLPLVSVTIPSYNAGSTLAEALDSVLAQDYQNIEIIVVDDGSSDDTQEVLKRYAAKVRCLRQDNSGLASARNAACRAAQGKYIALMDADDICMTERLSVQVAYMEQHPDVDLCSSDFAAFNANGVIADSYIAEYYARIADTPDGVAGIYRAHNRNCLAGCEVATYSGHVYEQMVLGNFVHPPTVLFRRSILEKCGLLDERLNACSDFDWFVRMSRDGKFGFLDRVLLKYRLSENQISAQSGRVQMVLEILQVMEKTFAEDPDLFKNRPDHYRRHLGKAYLNTAYVLADDHYLAAVGMLIRSMMSGILNWQSSRVAVKLIIPRKVLEWKRELSRFFSRPV